MKSSRWSLYRLIGQVVFWFVFISSIIYLHDPIVDVKYGFYPSLSIHSITIGLIISHTVKYASIGIAIFVGTFVLGRFFCGWICPLGATIDAADVLVTKEKIKTNPERFAKVKFLILLTSIIVAILGFNAAGYIDPITIAYRSYELFLYPFVSFIGSEPLSWILPGYQARDYPFYYYNWAWIALIFFIILALSKLLRRFWCRVLCPLGAMYALVSHFSIFRRIVDTSKCVHCGACVKGCRMGAIATDGVATIEHECIRCFDCLKHCKYDAISFEFESPTKVKSASIPCKGITRKDLLIVAGSSVMIAASKVSLFAASHESFIIRPPGALPETRFLDACIRCGQCMNVCPTNALHPCIGESGFYGMFTPRLISRIGYCDFTCTRCGNVCPTGAIRELSLKEKQKYVIGTAYIIRDICIPWSQAQNCIVCEEVCPVANKAITLEKTIAKNKDGVTVELLLPVVHEDRCIGCGICENRCPVSGQSAIVIRKPKLRIGEHYG
ncbi:MAG: 4Fe-4S binding protein [Spirochaetes bacterium]|nr:4Fe-4S binding protein [Spirochaetota bacterium]